MLPRRLWRGLPASMALRPTESLSEVFVLLLTHPWLYLVSMRTVDCDYCRAPAISAALGYLRSCRQGPRRRKMARSPLPSAGGTSSSRVQQSVVRSVDDPAVRCTSIRPLSLSVFATPRAAALGLSNMPTISCKDDPVPRCDRRSERIRTVRRVSGRASGFKVFLDTLYCIQFCIPVRLSVCDQFVGVKRHVKIEIVVDHDLEGFSMHLPLYRRWACRTGVRGLKR